MAVSNQRHDILREVLCGMILRAIPAVDSEKSEMTSHCTPSGWESAAAAVRQLPCSAKKPAHLSSVKCFLFNIIIQNKYESWLEMDVKFTLY